MVGFEKFNHKQGLDGLHKLQISYTCANIFDRITSIRIILPLSGNKNKLFIY
jgi:hypothetical protein